MYSGTLYLCNRGQLRPQKIPRVMNCPSMNQGTLNTWGRLWLLWLSFYQKPILQSLPVYSGDLKSDLDFEWSKRGWVTNGLDFEWHLKSGSTTIWNLDKWPPFCQKLFQIGTKMSGFWMVRTIAIAMAKAWPFENRTIKNPTSKKFGFQMVGFQIPIV